MYYFYVPSIMSYMKHNQKCIYGFVNWFENNEKLKIIIADVIIHTFFFFRTFKPYIYTYSKRCYVTIS